MRFHAALGTTELSPWKHREAQRDGGRIQRQQLVLEPEFMLAGAQPLVLAKARQRGPEQFLEQGCRAVLVGVGQGGSAGRFGDADMHQTAQATGQSVADVAQGIGAAQLAKEHGDELCPAGKALGGALGVMFFHQCGELDPGKMPEQLIEEAGSLYDCLGPPRGRRSAKLPAKEPFASVQL